MTIGKTTFGNKIYLYDSDTRFIKDQAGNGEGSLTAAGVVHELIESYKQNNDVKQIQAEMQKEIAEISQKQNELQKMMAAINWRLSSLTGLSSDLAWQGQRNSRLCGTMTREEFEKGSSALPKMSDPLKEQK